MSTPVIITAIICGTLLASYVISVIEKSINKKGDKK